MITISDPRNSVLLAAGMFGLGLTVGAWSGALPRIAVAAEPAPLPRSGHPAQVVRVIDGDTFEARVAVWPGLEVATKVRLRGVDAPELRARCPGELAQARAAREALATILAEGAVGVSGVTLDKYGGRVLADASTRGTADVAAALLRAGLVRGYAGGRRESWC